MRIVRWKISLMLLLCISVSIFSCAQNTVGQQKPKRKTKVETTYNEIANETIARIGPFELWKPPHNSVSGEISFERVDLQVLFAYPGKKIVTPKSVTMMIFSATQKSGDFESQAIGDFEKMRAFSVFTDSVQYSFGEMEIVGVGKGQRLSKGVLVREVLKKDVPLEDFGQIAQSQKAEMKIGSRKFKLTKEHLEAFRNFVSLMKEEGLIF